MKGHWFDFAPRYMPSTKNKVSESTYDSKDNLQKLFEQKPDKWNPSKKDGKKSS